METDPLSLQAYLHQHIPLTQAMEIAVAHAGPHRVTLEAPLAPNMNHLATVFGGSASTVGILAAWSMLHVRLQAFPEVDSSIVIQRNSMEYSHPITTDFEATCHCDDSPAWNQFLKSLRRKGVGRLELSSTLKCQGQTVGSFSGTFVAWDLNRRRP